MQYFAGTVGKKMSKPGHAGGVLSLVVQDSCIRILKTSCWFDTHCRLLGVVVSDQSQFKEKVDLLVGGSFMSLVVQSIVFFLVALIMKK